ncbi:MAG TPA: large conductance mechanosensitive channel protein MscL [Streptosporangiaceae bacterium]|nr:large conductance mechanosensitive channel protein MscL [Streptosporangiaceae bacterium]
MKGFRRFLLRGNIVELAVAVVMGVAFNNIVQAMVRDIITPLIGAAGGTPNFGRLTVTLAGSAIRYGLFLNAVIAFTIIAAVVYFLLVAPMSRLLAFAERRREATERDCPECLSVIPSRATRCKYCTAAVAPAPQQATQKATLPRPSLTRRSVNPRHGSRQPTSYTES